VIRERVPKYRGNLRYNVQPRGVKPNREYPNGLAEAEMNVKVFVIVVLLLFVAVGTAPAAPDSRSESTVNLELRDVDARSALEVLFRAGGKQYTLESGVFGSIGSVSFKDTPFETALRQLCRSAGLVYRLTDDIYTVTVRPLPQALPPSSPPPGLPVIPAPADDVVYEKIRLTYSSAAEILSSLGQGQDYGGVTAFAAIPGSAQQQFGQPTMGIPTTGQYGRGVQVPQAVPSPSYRPVGVAVSR
jgi:hypothetical protein